MRLVAKDGRVSQFPRVWATVNTADGRTGVGWMEWNRNQQRASGGAEQRAVARRGDGRLRLGQVDGGCGAGTRLGVPFADADTLHPPANVAKMAAGAPLDDDDRYPGWTRSGSGWPAMTTAW